MTAIGINPIYLQLATLRHQAKLPAREIAQTLGVSINAVCTWENGTKAPTVENLRRWAAYFGYTLALKRSDDMSGRPPKGAGTTGGAGTSSGNGSGGSTGPGRPGTQGGTGGSKTR